MAVTRMSKSSILSFDKYRNMSANSVAAFTYLVVAGGASGGNVATGTVGDGGGGAGGYRSSVSGESSGGGASAESPIFVSDGQSFTVTVGAGGAGATGSTAGNAGSNSVFSTVTSLGGAPISGGGSGSGSRSTNIYPGTAGQGYDGGRITYTQISSEPNPAGGGGGAGAVGETVTSVVAQGGDGGIGVASSITGSSVYRAGGGPGNVDTRYGSSIGAYPSGQGGSYNGGTNLGGGGGGGASNITTSGAGGSGVVILKYPAAFSLIVGAGLTYSTSVSGEYKITQFTAGSDTVTVDS